MSLIMGLVRPEQPELFALELQKNHYFEHKVIRVSYCDHSPSVIRLSGIRSHFLVYTLASTNINQSAPNMVQMYMTIRSWMSSIKVLNELDYGSN